jgi:hypothetical protein
MAVEIFVSHRYRHVLSALLDFWFEAKAFFAAATVGDQPCRKCWHKGRHYGWPACLHPAGIDDCQTYEEASHFLERPPLRYRLRHPLSWRKGRLAAMRLVPPHARPDDLSALGVATRRAFVPQMTVQLYKTHPLLSQLSPQPTPTPPPGLGALPNGGTTKGNP